MTFNTTEIDLQDAVVRESADGYLSDALVRTRMRRPGRQAADLHPSMGPVMARLCFAVTDVPVNRFTDRPLIDSAIEHGLSAFFNVTKPTHDGPCAFLQAAFHRLADLYATTVVEGSATWNIQSGVPLGSWLIERQRGPDRGRTRDVSLVDSSTLDDPAAFRRTLLQMVASPGDLVAMNTTSTVVINPSR